MDDTIIKFRGTATPKTLARVAAYLANSFNETETITSITIGFVLDGTLSVDVIWSDGSRTVDVIR